MNGINEINKKDLIDLEKFLSDKPEYIKGFSNYLTDASIRTKSQYAREIVAFMKYTEKDVKELTVDDFIGYMAHRKYRKDGKELTAAFQIKLYAALKRFSEYLYYSGKISKHYMADVKRPKARESQETKQKREKGFLTDKEIKKVLREIEERWIYLYRDSGDELRIRNKAIICTFLTTGIRESALLGLDVDDIDFQNSLIRVTDKGTKARSIYISKELVGLLKKWLEARDKLVAKGPGTNALFVSQQGARLSRKALFNMVKTICKCIDGKNITPHKLRATYGTKLYEETHDIKFVQDCMGHTTSTTTELYIRGRKNETKKASDIMSKGLGI